VAIEIHLFNFQENIARVRFRAVSFELGINIHAACINQGVIVKQEAIQEGQGHSLGESSCLTVR